MGVLVIAFVKFRAFSSVEKLVLFALMISTNFILCTGEKKCIPINLSLFFIFDAKIDIGIVEVLDAIIPSGFINFSAVLSASDLISKSS